ncbi:MAG: DUF4118 domain-containing protein [Butyricicoccus sp.]
MKRQDGKPRLFSFTLRDFLIFAAIFICALVLCTLLRRSDISDGFASPVFVLAVLLISRFTNGYLFGTLAAFLSVIGINYIFTFPYWEFNFTMTGYPLTFFVMLCVSLITCTMTTRSSSRSSFMESEREKRANLLRSVSRHPHATDLHHWFNLGHSGNARPVSRTAASAARGCAR